MVLFFIFKFLKIALKETIQSNNKENNIKEQTNKFINRNNRKKSVYIDCNKAEILLSYKNENISTSLTKRNANITYLYEKSI